MGDIFITEREIEREASVLFEDIIQQETASLCPLCVNV